MCAFLVSKSVITPLKFSFFCTAVVVKSKEQKIKNKQVKLVKENKVSDWVSSSPFNNQERLNNGS